MTSPLFRKRLFSSSGSKEENPNDSAVGLAPKSAQVATKPFSSSSDGALSTASTSHSLVTKPIVKRRRSGSKKGNRAKASFLSRFVHRVVPCVSSVDALTRVDLEKSPVPTPTIKEKPGDNASSIDTDLPLTVPPINVYPPAPPSPTDSEIIIPPPPIHHLLPEEETDGLTSGAVQAPGSTGHEMSPTTTPPTPSTSTTSQIERTRTRESDHSESTNYSDEEELPDTQHQILLDEQAEEERLIRQGGAGIPTGPDGVPKPLLPPIAPEHIGRKCLVLDLDETLVHSSFKAVPQADFIVPVEIEYHWHHFHVLKRPGVDNFLKRMGELYEVVVFTASLSKYADPVLDKLDIHHVVAHRLFRESCYNHKGNYVKDLSQLGRPLSSTIILDNSPASYIFHPHNAVPVSSWFNDPHDAELTDLVPFLDDLSTMGNSECEGGGWMGDIRGVLDGGLEQRQY